MQHITGGAAPNPRQRLNLVPSHPAPAGAGVGDYYTAHSDAGLTVEKVRPAYHVIVAVDVPVKGGTDRIVGRLIASVSCNGDVHHYRIDMGKGVLLMAHPHWIDPGCLSAIHAAGVPVHAAGKKAIIRQLVGDVRELADKGCFS